MRFLHLSDLHLGKRVCEFSMLEEQRAFLRYLADYAAANAVDAVLLAGDIYDRSVPPAEAVQVLDEFWCSLHRAGIPVLAVPGSIYSALSEGTNELLRTHRAEPLCKAADALDILGIGAETAAPAQQRFDPATVSADAQAVYAVLKPTPQSIDALCAAASLPAGRVLAACTELELMGGAQAQPGRRYIAV